MKRLVAVILILLTVFPIVSLAVDQVSSTARQQAYEKWESFANKRISELVKSYEKSKTLWDGDILELTNLVIARLTAEGANTMAEMQLIGSSYAEADLSMASLIAVFHTQYKSGSISKNDYLSILIEAAKDLTE